MSYFYYVSCHQVLKWIFTVLKSLKLIWVFPQNNTKPSPLRRVPPLYKSVTPHLPNPGRLGLRWLSSQLAPCSLLSPGFRLFPPWLRLLITSVSVRGPGVWAWWRRLGAARLSLQCVRRCRQACLGADFLFLWSFSLPEFEDGCLSSFWGGPMALFLNFAFPFFSLFPFWNSFYVLVRPFGLSSCLLPFLCVVILIDTFVAKTCFG